MASTLALSRTAARRPSTGSRFGYTLAIVINGVMLWAANHLLEWGWPRFLTDDFERVLPLVRASFVASMIANACFVFYDRGWFRALGDLATSVLGLAVALKMWDVFPFDFSGYDRDWSWLARVLLALGIVGTAIGVIANVVKLVWKSTGEDDHAPMTSGAPR